MTPTSGLLLDTDIIAELRSPSPHPAVIDFLRRRRHFRIYVSALTIGELYVLSKQDGHFQETGPWLREFEDRYGANILPIDALVAAAWGSLAAHTEVPAVASLIAATALQKSLAVVSGNVQPYLLLAVPVINPWSVGNHAQPQAT